MINVFRLFKYTLFFFSIIVFLSSASCNRSLDDVVEDLGEPRCKAFNLFGGFSLIYTEDCGCGNNNDFFGPTWNLSCETQEELDAIVHVNYVGDREKWKTLTDFFKSRDEPEAKVLLQYTEDILLSSKNGKKPQKYYRNIDIANEYLQNLESESLIEAMRIFYNDVVLNF